MTSYRILDEHIDGLRRTFGISVDADPIVAAVESRLQKMRRTARMPGFRRGRVPLGMLRNLYGQHLRAAVVDQLAIDVARRLIVEKGLEPTRRPTIHIDEESAASSESVTFNLLLEVMPQVVLGPLDGFQLRHLRVTNEHPALIEQGNEHLRRQLFDKLMTLHGFPVPQDMVENEYARIGRGFEAEVGQVVDAEVEQELRRIAARRVRLAILLTEIGRTHDISVPRSEVEALVQRQAERDPEHQAEIIDYYLDHPTALAELQSPLFEKRVVEFLLSRSEIEVVDLSAEEFQLAMEQL